MSNCCYSVSEWIGRKKKNTKLPLHIETGIVSNRLRGTEEDRSKTSIWAKKNLLRSFLMDISARNSQKTGGSYVETWFHP